MRRKSNVVSLIVGFFSSIFAFLGIVTCCGYAVDYLFLPEYWHG